MVQNAGLVLPEESVIASLKCIGRFYEQLDHHYSEIIDNTLMAFDVVQPITLIHGIVPNLTKIYDKFSAEDQFGDFTTEAPLPKKQSSGLPWSILRISVKIYSARHFVY